MPVRQHQAKPPRPRGRVAAALVVTLLAPLLLMLSTATPARAAESETKDPLAMTIDQLDTVGIDGRTKGRINLRGKVVNTTDEEWSGVKVYPFVGDTPITTSEELAEAAELPADALVGERIVTEETSATIPDLAPGESYSWSLTVPRKLLEISEPGVYWFGVHALGTTTPNAADGRARTFLPLVKQPKKKAKAQKVSLVVPLRRSVVYDADGSVDYLPGWTRDLREGGRLYRMLETGAEMPALTWAIDPAMIDAVRNLAQGNPGRNLSATDGEEPEESGSQSASPSTSALVPSPSASAESDEEPIDEEAEAARDAARTWLARLEDALAGHNLLALPYGDPDLSALATTDPDLLATAREQTAEVLAELGIKATAAVAPPTGYLDRAAVNLLEPDGVHLVSDRMFRGEAPVIADLDGSEMVVTSSAAAAGGPGPNDPIDAVSVRQRLAAEAALLRGTGKPLVAVLPDGWHPPQTADAFVTPWTKAPWISPSTLTEAMAGHSATPVTPDKLRYPRREMKAEIPAAQIDTANELIGAGELLQRVLTHNDEVAADITREALTSASYFARKGDTDSAVDALDQISAELSSITVSVPPKVILSSMKGGEFQVTLSNELDEPVTVRLDAITDESLRVATSEPVQLDANSKASFNLAASMLDTGTHTALIVVTDTKGNPLGAHASVPIRPSQVSGVIWWFVGTGCALLFAAIAVRLTRRIMKAKKARTSGEM
ncbi:hypothetical protein J2S40_004037 [Nocardioides luteus]|uniref:Glycoprotein n=1 Tax=Nocardioides luteus TaxID=1844 RepID=A0ABQ5SR61_9ACTN|nr:DUF6049 family protein [Nocardioides luteus]MDR7312979.1 hypothetical protein [Nocardioides luteus]GGR44925.1 hypothetical protein GCM10010197_08220 [Nocardioides luteus]GLJ66038.1 hypothetical protein GCM10017579_00740 [Nocardioides luteus]